MRRTHPLLLATLLTVAALGPAAANPTPENPAPAAAPAPVPATGTGNAYSPPWDWPLDPAPSRIRYFDPPAQPWLAGHRGVDMAATSGMVILAPADGRVVFGGRVVDRPVLTIDHGGGLKSSFEPVAASVPVGAEVLKGAAVGSVGSGGHCSPDCLHWGVRLDGDYVDPLNYVSDRRPSVLLPVPPR